MTPWRALTLRQPHASLVALGIKTMDTRSWPTAHRGPLIIHAGARKPPLLWSQDGRPPIVDEIPGCYSSPQEASNNPGQFSYEWVGPLSAALATCTLVDCVPITGEPSPRDPGKRVLAVDRDGVLRDWRKSDLGGCPGWCGTGELAGQRPYGDFTPGRFAWLLADVKPLRTPRPIRGRPGLWASRALDLAIDIDRHGYANVCRYCFAPLLHSEGDWCSDTHKAAFGRPVRGNGAEVINEFRVDGPVTDSEQMELA